MEVVVSKGIQSFMCLLCKWILIKCKIFANTFALRLLHATVVFEGALACPQDAFHNATDCVS